MLKVRSMVSADGPGMVDKYSMRALSMKISITGLADTSTFTVFATLENLIKASERVKEKVLIAWESSKMGTGSKIFTRDLELVQRRRVKGRNRKEQHDRVNNILDQ